MKYEQEDLLEKFIQNEKKSRFWALLSAVGFIVVSTGVVFVANEVKGDSKTINAGPGADKKDTIHKTDTFLLTKDDPKLNQQLIYLRDSLIKARQREKETRIAYDKIKLQYEKEKAEADKLKIIYKDCDDNNGKLTGEIEKLKIVYKECNDKYNTVYEEVQKLQIKLKDCGGKPVTPVQPLATKQISVLINYYSQVPDTTVDKLQKILSKSKTKIVFSRKKMQKGLKPVVMYFNADDIKMADYISSVINNKLYFRTDYKYTPYFNSTTSNPAGYFEIWLVNIY